MNQRARDRDPLQLAARQVSRIAVASSVQSNRFEHRLRACVRDASVGRDQCQRQRYILYERQIGQNMEGLEDKADLLSTKAGARALVKRAKFDTVNHDAARVGFVEPGQDVEQGRLADPRLADDRDQFARRDVEVERAKQ